MIGSNELRLNNATMEKAVQFWLDSQLIVKQRVTQVKQNMDEFVIKLEEIKEPLNADR